MITTIASVSAMTNATEEESEDSVRMFISNVLLFFARPAASEPVMQGLVNMYRVHQGDRSARRTYIRGVIGSNEYPSNVVLSTLDEGEAGVDAPTDTPRLETQADPLAEMKERLITHVQEREKYRLARKKADLKEDIRSSNRSIRELEAVLHDQRVLNCKANDELHLIRTRTSVLTDMTKENINSLVEYVHNSSLYLPEIRLGVDGVLKIPTRDVMLRDFRPDHGINRTVNLGSMWVVINIQNFEVYVRPRTKNLITNMSRFAPSNYSLEYSGDSSINGINLHPHISGSNLCMGTLGSLYSSLRGKSLTDFDNGSALVHLVRGVEGILTTYNHESPYTNFIYYEFWAMMREAVLKVSSGVGGSLVDCLPAPVKQRYILLLAQNVLRGNISRESIERGELLERLVHVNFSDYVVGDIYNVEGLPDFMSNGIGLNRIKDYACHQYYVLFSQQNIEDARTILQEQYDNITDTSQKVRARRFIGGTDEQA